jgi:hypothetical protein
VAFLRQEVNAVTEKLEPTAQADMCSKLCADLRLAMPAPGQADAILSAMAATEASLITSHEAKAGGLDQRLTNDNESALLQLSISERMDDEMDILASPGALSAGSRDLGKLSTDPLCWFADQQSLSTTEMEAALTMMSDIRGQQSDCELQKQAMQLAFNACFRSLLVLFDPDPDDQAATNPGVSWFSASKRKAQLWDRCARRFRLTLAEADRCSADIFYTTFLPAYERTLSDLETSPTDGASPTTISTLFKNSN